MRKIILTSALCFFPLLSCSLLRNLTGKTQKAIAGPAEIVAPSALLDGPAARLQDSLKPRLDWLAAHAPKSWEPKLIAFQNDSDTAHPFGLLVETIESERRNSHRKNPEDIARDEAHRILQIMPWRREAIESKLAFPLSVRVLYRSRDFLVSSSRFTEDTITVRYSDSTVIWKSAPLKL